ncbi:major capsid protein [Cedecea lapagei]|uniref:major capsid protein n=1 Tax=Cedecea lapagei TaxID=158823 RepID=UPI00202312CC|nr:major capsid protein [Cedecea lapagei]
MKVNQNQVRELDISRSINTEDRTVELAFISETPVQRDFGDGQILNEILLTTPDSVDLSRLLSGAPLLYNHDSNIQLGIIEDAWIDNDRVGRAIARFSTVGIAEEKFRMVQEGILHKVSFGYTIQDYYIEGDNLYVTRLLATEISLVTIPADDKVGLGRAINNNDKTTLNKESKSMTKRSKREEVFEEKDEYEFEEDREEEDNFTDEDVDYTERKKRAKRTKREQIENEDETENFTDEDVDYTERKKRAKRKVREEEIDDEEDRLAEDESYEEEFEEEETRSKRKKRADEDEDFEEEFDELDDEEDEIEEMRKREIRSIAKAFGINPAKAIRSGVSVKQFKNAIKARSLETKGKESSVMKNEKSVIDALVRGVKGDRNATINLKQGERGGFELTGKDLMRAPTNTTTAAGTVETQYDTDFIRPLLAESVLGRVGIEVITGVVGREFTIPRLTSIDAKANMKFYAEGQAIEESVANFDNIVLTPKLFAGSFQMTRSLLLTAPNAAKYVQDTLMENLANSLERQMISTVATAAVQLETAVSGTVDAADIEAAIEKLASANVRVRDCFAIVSPKMYAALRLTPWLNNVAGMGTTEGFRGQDQWLANECPLIVSTFAADDTILIGKWDMFAVANWVGSTLDWDDTTYRSSLSIVLRQYHYLDMVVKHPEAFVQLSVKA